MADNKNPIWEWLLDLGILGACMIINLVFFGIYIVTMFIIGWLFGR